MNKKEIKGEIIPTSIQAANPLPEKDQSDSGVIRPEFMDSPMILGKKIEILMPNGEKRKGQFAIVDLDNIIASHNEHTFSTSEGYPVNEEGNNINDRNYHDDPNAQAKVLDVAQNLEPSILITTSRTPTGTPIITTDGIVVSGNNRTMSLKLALQNYPEKYEEYKKLLLEESEAFGIKNIDVTAILMGERIPDQRKPFKPFDLHTDKDSIKIKHPVLVRIDYDFPEYRTIELSKYNKDTKKSERPIDKVIKLSNILNEKPNLKDAISHIVGEFETLSDFYSNLKSQQELVHILKEGNILTEQEIPSYYSESGFNEAGKDLIESILASIVLKKEALTASEMPGVKRLRGIVITSLPVLVKNTSLPEGNLTDSINKAIVLEKKILASGLSFQDYISQENMFEEKPDKKVVVMNRLLNSGRNNFKKSIEAYNESVTDNQGESLFGTKPTQEEIFKVHIEAKIDAKEDSLIEKFIVNNTFKEIDNLFHGTCNKFERFDKVHLGENTGDPLSFLGFHFTPSFEVAKLLLFEKNNKDCQIFKVSIKVRNTLKTSESELVANIVRFGFEKGLLKNIKVKISEENIKEFFKLPYFDYNNNSQFQILVKWKDQFDFEKIARDYLKEILLPKGYDSIEYLNEIELLDEKRYDWIVFDESSISIKELIKISDEQDYRKSQEPFFADYTSDLFLKEVGKFRSYIEFKKRYEELNKWIDVKDKAKLGIIKIKDTNWFPTKDIVAYAKDPDDYPFFRKLIEYVKEGKGITPIVVELGMINNGRPKVYYVRDGEHRLSAYELAGIEFIPALVYGTSKSTLTRNFDNPEKINIEKFLNIDLKEIFSKAQSLKNSDIPKAKPGDFFNYEKTIENVLIPQSVREPFASHVINQKDLQKEINQGKFDDLLKLTKEDLPHISAPVMYELIQLGHPDEYKIKISRGELQKEWEKRGEEIFKELGLPVDPDYPYVNKYTGYKSVDPLSVIIERVNNNEAYWWWTAAEHSLPIADLNKGIEIMDSMMNGLKEELKKFINSSTGKSKRKFKSEVNSINFDLRELEEGKNVIKNYLQKRPVDENELKEKQAKAQSQRLRLLKKKLELKQERNSYAEN